MTVESDVTDAREYAPWVVFFRVVERATGNLYWVAWFALDMHTLTKHLATIRSTYRPDADFRLEQVFIAQGPVEIPVRPNIGRR